MDLIVSVPEFIYLLCTSSLIARRCVGPQTKCRLLSQSMSEVWLLTTAVFTPTSGFRFLWF